jgi:hypothetical protein
MENWLLSMEMDNILYTHIYQVFKFFHVVMFLNLSNIWMNVNCKRLHPKSWALYPKQHVHHLE